MPKALAAVAEQPAIVQQCPHRDLCFQLNIPEASSTSNNGDLYFQIRARSSYQWVALGQGTRMADSNMFIL